MSRTDRLALSVALMRVLWILPFACGIAIVPPALAQTAVSVAASIGDFHLAVSNYYRVPEREVVVIRERRISDDDLPVVLFIARRASVPPSTIVSLRLGGLSWWEISRRYGIGPEVYYVPVAADPGPPYGRAYGHYKKKNRQQWNTIVLSDADVVNMVHLRFLSEHYNIAPERVIELHGRQGNLVAVHTEIAKSRGRGNTAAPRNNGSAGNARGRGNGGNAGNAGGNPGRGRGRGR